MSRIEQVLKEKPVLSADKIHVFLYQISLFNSKDLVEYLPEDEGHRADRLRIEQKREQFVITRSLLRLLLSSNLGKEPRDIVFSYEKQGKPVVKDYINRVPIEFNISHSGDYALIAMTLENKVGVDIEEVNPDIDYKSLSNRFFSEKERNDLINLDEKQQCDAFYRIWARKESFIKATGQGISFGLDKFSVPINESIDDAREIITAEKLNDKWFCYELMKLDNYKTALTATTKNSAIIISSR
jgi:4'-phosphopantetheinyl transferase